MINYILADIRRISRKQSFIYTLGGFIGLFLLMIFIYYNPTFNQNAYLEKTDTFLGFFPLVMGLSIFLSIYYDDFKSKSMQIAIGYGISRSKVVLTKIIEVAILSLLSALLLGIVILVIPIFLKMSLSSKEIFTIILGVGAEALRIIGYISMSTILVYYSQNAMIGTIFYVLLSSKTVMLILATILGQGFIINSIGDLTKFMYTIILYKEKLSFIETGSFDFLIIAGILVYIVLPTIITIIMFRKKELEF
ncbi:MULTISPECIES: hypothetical protein [Clostridium]|uniref:ABC-2 family transporter protein n=1 Tax=Clostridium aquiflavi TaxID=3073603 RepID=A0ABU1EI34_9CLOT|nr:MULTISPECIES: hypothetical protein [unclassified Clostridium]MDR5588061.1 hypothetical protein [Clostridium sp. 5N-1]NFG62553.1 hypothetical protein [Clostridium botulinum]NFQ10754.1 hypothetical protein [Clostridium botulinum]